jgi:fructose-1,6-bisphosphatase I
VITHSATSVVTIDRFIIEQERRFPDATGEFSGVLYDLALAAKMISNKVRSAGLADVLGATARENVQGEVQQKLDVLANETIIKALDHGGRLCAMGSEEEDDLIPIPEGFKQGRYALLFDPLDGSSNIDVNVPVGTIFSVLKKVSTGPKGELTDLLQPGCQQVAAGYVIYGSSTMLVYTTGHGVHGFTLDPMLGEFLLSHPDMCIPERGRYLSVNDSYEPLWTDAVRALMRHYRGLDGRRTPLTGRYVGSLVADFHRNLIGGGIFAYPANAKAPSGKLRLLYEASPLAFIVEQAGGAATDGTRRILDIVPTALHQRTPLYIGSKHEVAAAEQFLSAPGTPASQGV